MKHRPNDPCPCGSGRKYKKCHASPVGAMRPAEPFRVTTVAEWLARGKQFEAAGRLQQAEPCYQQALQLAPQSLDAWLALAGLAERAGDLAAARDCYLCLLDFHPAYAAAQFALGNVHARLFAFEAARQAYLHALKLAPNLLGVWGNLGNVEKYLGRFSAAIDCYRHEVEQTQDVGDQARRHSNLLFSLHYDESLSHEALYQAHREWSDRYAQHFLPLTSLSPAPPDAGKLTRIGYVSGSFDGQIVGHFLQSVLAHHNPEQFSIYLYSSTKTHDACSEVLRRSCHLWVDIAQMDDTQAAQRIAADRIDLLVDLDGHSPTGRPLIFARKPAPVQVEWLDYFNTSGMESIDFFLTDPYTTPTNSPQRFSETPIRLPHSRFCYTPPSEAPPVMPMPCTSVGTPFTFGSFNRQDKLNPVLLRVWADILLAVPDSRLLLKNRALQVVTVREALTDAFVKLGVAPDRLLLREPSRHTEMLAEYGQIDLALDTFPYNGGLTSCECLWMGVPIIALEAERMIGRQTAAMLRLLQMDDWVATSRDDYVRLAVEKSLDRAGVGRLRAVLRQRMAESPLCDAPRFVRDLEAAYREMQQSKRNPPLIVPTNSNTYAHA